MVYTYFVKITDLLTREISIMEFNNVTVIGGGTLGS